jgi:hypothetical protein
MKKLILCVLATLAIYALLYAIWSFAHWELNPKDWEMGSRVCYCFFATAASAFANMGVMFYEPKKMIKQ